MLQPKMRGAATLLGLLASTVMSAAATAGERAYFRSSTEGQYWSEPQVRLGVDVVWGGHGYAPRRPPVIWYPAYYAPDPYYGPHYNPHYNQGHGLGHHKRHKHRRHAHHAHDRDACDD